MENKLKLYISMGMILLGLVSGVFFFGWYIGKLVFGAMFGLSDGLQ